MMSSGNVEVSSRSNAEVEACRMIESVIHDMMPSLDKRLSERLSRVYLSHMDLQRMPIDTSTSFGRDFLKRRLQRLSKIMIKRAAQRQQQRGVARRPVRRVSYESSSDSRYQVLKSIVGPDMFKEIHAVSQEINNVRNSSVLWMKYTPQNPPLPSLQINNSDEVSLAECKLEEKEEEEDRLPLGKILPAPIADIYFKTHLVERMQASMTSSCNSFIQVGGVALMVNSDCNCGCIVHRTAWNDLLRDSKTILAAYRKFEAEN